MERDMELIRIILQEVKKYNNPHGLSEIPEIDGYSNSQVSYHIKILCDAGLLNAEPIPEMGTKYDDFTSINLTWLGQDFIDAANDDTIWAKAKDTFIKPGVSFTFGILLDWLKMKAKEKIGLL